MKIALSLRIAESLRRHTEEEPEIVVNGVRLTQAQAASVRVAVTSFRLELNAGGSEELGEIGPLYDARLAEVELLLVQEWSVRKARRFAEQHHAGQTYNGGKDSYMVHLDAVHGVAKSVGLPEEFLTAAYLHDVLEDTPITYAQLTDMFGKTVADLVEAVTGRGATRGARNGDAYHKIIEAGAPAALLKMCDRIVNAEFSNRLGRRGDASFFTLYLSEQPAFMGMIHKAMLGATGEEARVFLVLRKRLEDVFGLRSP